MGLQNYTRIRDNLKEVREQLYFIMEDWGEQRVLWTNVQSRAETLWIKLDSYVDEILGIPSDSDERKELGNEAFDLRIMLGWYVNPIRIRRVRECYSSSPVS